MADELTIRVTEDGADAEQIDNLTGYLRRELLNLEVADVRPLPGGSPPAGSRAFEVADVGALLVSLGSSAGGLKEVVTVVRSWLSRSGSARRHVRIEMAGDVLELSEASLADQNKLVDLFVSHHSGDQH